MEKKLGRIYGQYSSSKDKYKLLMKKLKEVLQQEIEEMLKKNMMFSPPFDPFKIKRIGKARIEVVYKSRSEINTFGSLKPFQEVSTLPSPRSMGSPFGSIKPFQEGFLIEIDRELKGKKLRSTMAHELAHTFLYDTNKLPPVRLGYSYSRKILAMEEELCYFLDRELLMPTFSIKQIKPIIKEPTIKNIEFLEYRYKVSSDVVAYRLISDLKIWNAIFIKFEQSGTFYKSKIKLKGKQNSLFKKLKIPAYLPSNSLNGWFNILSNHITQVVEKGIFQEIVKFDNNEIKIESKIKTKKPLTIITIVTPYKPVKKLLQSDK